MASALVEDRELGARLLDGDARPQAAEHAQHARVAAADVRVEAERHPDLRHARPHRRRMKPVGEDADERVRPSAQDDRLSEHRGIAVIAPHPERVADDRHCRRAGSIFGRQEPAPQGGLDAEHVEYSGAGARAADPLRLFAAGEREPWRIVGRELGE